MNPLKTRSAVKCIDNESLTVVSGGYQVLFTGSANNYYNFASLIGLTDYTQQTDSYQYVRLRAVKLEFTRAADELTVLNAVRGGSIYLNYYPDVSSVSLPYSAISHFENAYKLDLMTFEPQVVVCPAIDMLYLSAGGVVFNTSWLTSVTTFNTLIQGMIAVATDNTTVASSTQKIFSVKITYD